MTEIIFGALKSSRCACAMPSLLYLVKILIKVHLVINYQVQAFLREIYQRPRAPHLTVGALLIIILVSYANLFVEDGAEWKSVFDKGSKRQGDLKGLIVR